MGVLVKEAREARKGKGKMKKAKKRKAFGRRAGTVFLVFTLVVTMLPATMFAVESDIVAPSSEMVSYEAAVEPAGTTVQAVAAEESVLVEKTVVDANAKTEGLSALQETPASSVTPTSTPTPISAQTQTPTQIGIMPLAAGDITSIDTVVNPASFQTFDNLATGTAPPTLYLSVQVQIAATYVSGWAR